MPTPNRDNLSSPVDHAMRSSRSSFDPADIPPGYDTQLIARLQAQAPRRQHPVFRWAAMGGTLATAAVVSLVVIGPLGSARRAPPTVADRALNPRDINRDGVVDILDAHALALSPEPILADGTTPADIRDALVELTGDSGGEA
ncbi:MAG: hypothetical protein AAF747_02105 [Planctomycetota bacterium]